MMKRSYVLARTHYSYTDNAFRRPYQVAQLIYTAHMYDELTLVYHQLGIQTVTHNVYTQPNIHTEREEYTLNETHVMDNVVLYLPL